MKVNFERIYEHIGYLFYAIASEHRQLNAVSYNKLTDLIDQQWYPATNEVTLETTMAGYLHTGLNNAMNSAMTANKAFERFRNYFELHSFPFGNSLRLKIVNTANRIASDFSGNGTKSDFVKELEKLFEVKPILLM